MKKEREGRKWNQRRVSCGCLGRKPITLYSVIKRFSIFYGGGSGAKERKAKTSHSSIINQISFDLMSDWMEALALRPCRYYESKVNGATNPSTLFFLSIKLCFIEWKEDWVEGSLPRSGAAWRFACCFSLRSINSHINFIDEWADCRQKQLRYLPLGPSSIKNKLSICFLIPECLSLLVNCFISFDQIKFHSPIH